MTQIIGRIYRIASSECDGVYIGSTTRQLDTRFSGHKSTYKRYLACKYNYITSFEVMKFVDAKIELIHEGVFDSKKDMEQFEGDTIRTTPNAVNKIVVGRSSKQYREDNKEAIAQYREDNKEATAPYQQQYRNANREAIREHANTKCTCPTCGGRFTWSHKAKHFKTILHQNAVSSSVSYSTGSEQDETDDEHL